jgi:hypothetical protein
MESGLLIMTPLLESGTPYQQCCLIQGTVLHVEGVQACRSRDLIQSCNTTTVHA